MFEWKKEYETGLKTIDEQHQKLFEIANNSYDLLKNDMILDKYDRIVQILNELMDYCEYHFSTEEKFLLDIGYKKFVSHKAQHEEFIKKMRNADLDEIDENQDEYIMGLLEFFANWLSGHILVKDMDYVRYNRTLS